MVLTGPKMARHTRSGTRRLIFLSLLALWLATLLWQTHKPLPPGVHVTSPPVMVAGSDVHFLHDLSWQDAGTGQRRAEQQIFDAVLAQIDTAEHFIVLDFFLINDAAGQSTATPLRHLSAELVDHLLARKHDRPDIQILLITDPINDVYGGAPSYLLAQLQSAGMTVVRTDLTRLRDSNAAYSALWRMFVQWFGNGSGGWLPNPFDAHARPISLRSWLSLLNFKANHRKVIVSDRADGEWVATVASANPHDASSAHSNVALQFSGELAHAVVDSELQVARFSGWTGKLQTEPHKTTQQSAEQGVILSYLTEGAIRERVIDEIQTTQAGDAIQMAMFYLSDRDVIDALKAAMQRGVNVQLILDPNKDAFGLEKDGVPNRPVAHELLQADSKHIAVRWYATHGEQFHTKLLLVRHAQQLFVTLGSANFTRRNLADYNLEANVALSMNAQSALAREFDAYFNRIWQGDATNASYTLPADAYRDDSALRYWRYSLMEVTGLSTF